MILSYNERKTVESFHILNAAILFSSSLLRHSVKFVKWRLPCISHFVSCSLQQQSLKPEELVAPKNFCMEMQHTRANYDDLFSCFVFSDETSSHLSGKVDRCNVWEEFDYGLDVCRVTNGAHIVHL